MPMGVGIMSTKKPMILYLPLEWINHEKVGVRMEGSVITLENITALVKPLTKKYHVKEIYLFGSYARGEADENSDLDFLVFGGEGFKLTSILALGEELREVLKKKVDIFEIREVNQDSEFYRTIMREKVFVA